MRCSSSVVVLWFQRYQLPDPSPPIKLVLFAEIISQIILVFQLIINLTYCILLLFTVEKLKMRAVATCVLGAPWGGREAWCEHG